MDSYARLNSVSHAAGLTCRVDYHAFHDLQPRSPSLAQVQANLQKHTGSATAATVENVAAVSALLVRQIVCRIRDGKLWRLSSSLPATIVYRREDNL